MLIHYYPVNCKKQDNKNHYHAIQIFIVHFLNLCDETHRFSEDFIPIEFIIEKLVMMYIDWAM